MKYAIALATAALVLGTAAIAQAAANPATPAEQCFRSRDMSNHRRVDDQTLYLKVGVKDVYRLQSKGKCFTGLTSTEPLVIKTTGGSGMICRPLDLDLSVKHGNIATPCIVDSITKLTPEEVAAIPKGQKP